MKCNICNQEKEKTIPFYWGFFKTKYEPEKWINACEKCCRRFQKASHTYSHNRTELLELEQEIKNNIELLRLEQEIENITEQDHQTKIRTLKK